MFECAFVLPAENNGAGQGVNSNLSQVAHGNSLLPPGVWRCLSLCPDGGWGLAGTLGWVHNEMGSLCVLFPFLGESHGVGHWF